MNTEIASRAQERVTTCDHKFIDSPRCLKCGWAPPPASELRELLLHWAQATTDEQLEFLRQVKVRSTR